jgi:hypothetical protein
MNIGLKKLVVYGFYTFLILALVALVVASILVHDFSFIKKHPGLFFVESLLVTVGITLSLAYGLKLSRGFRIRSNLEFMGVLAFKVFAFHVLLQTAGIFSILLGDD